MVTDPESPLADPQQIQGNILRPFGGEHQAYLFLSFRHRRDEAREWLGAAAGRVDGTEQVAAGRAEGGIAPGRVFMGLGLTASGLVVLHPEVAGDLAGFDAFWRGSLGARLDDAGRLSTAPALLGDVGTGDPQHWLIGGPGRPPVDALLILAADDEQALAERVKQERQAATDAGLEVMPLRGADGEVAPDQRGSVLRGADGQRVEHFGFADGISQPGIRDFDEDERPGSPAIAAGEFILGCAGERRPQTWAPRPSPAPWMRGGSFQVFRRLRQDAAGWWERMARLGGDESTPEETAARALGRHLDGRPLAPVGDSAHRNDFTYSGDDGGTRTPLYAHIRKMNPRNDEVFRDRGHKLLRRGIPFGPSFDRDSPDGHERGLIFNAYMASIEDQFEFLQRRWANDPGFPASTVAKFRPEDGAGQRVDGLDPVLGDDAGAARERLGEQVVREIPRAAFGGFVTTTASVYAFAPSRPTLALLAGQRSLSALVSADG
jgi:Dyp-type peroxidase family